MRTQRNRGTALSRHGITSGLTARAIPVGYAAMLFLCPPGWWRSQMPTTPWASGGLTELANAEIGGTVVMWEWIGNDGATTFSY